MDTYENDRAPSILVYWTLILVILAVGVLVVSFFLLSDIETTKPVVDSASQHLSASSPVKPDATVQDMPKWIWLLVASIVLFQVFPLLVAYRRAQKRPLSRKEIRTIIVLCETPIYLGLLGSLLGVCLTQFLTGSLTAPLAYLTTISGILAYLFARFTIWLSLPSIADNYAE